MKSESEKRWKSRRNGALAVLKYPVDLNKERKINSISDAPGVLISLLERYKHEHVD